MEVGLTDWGVHVAPAGAVSLAGADSGLWAVDGGNKRVCMGLLYNSKSELVPARVTSIAIKARPSKTTGNFLRSGPIL